MNVLLLTSLAIFITIPSLLSLLGVIISSNLES